MAAIRSARAEARWSAAGDAGARPRSTTRINQTEDPPRHHILRSSHASPAPARSPASELRGRFADVDVRAGGRPRNAGTIGEEGNPFASKIVHQRRALDAVRQERHVERGLMIESE